MGPSVFKSGRYYCYSTKTTVGFDVVEAQNSIVNAGDRFMIGHTLYVDRLTHADRPPILFVMGKKKSTSSRLRRNM